MEAVDSFETSVNTYLAPQYHEPEDRNEHSL
jgi:hypothetical protein